MPVFFYMKCMYKGRSRILKWGVNFCNNVREVKYYFNIWGIRKKKKEGGLEKGGWKFTHFTSSGSAPDVGFPYEVCLQRNPKIYSVIIAAILNSTQQPCLVVWCHSIQEILSKWLPTSLLTTTLGYGLSQAVFFWAKRAPISKTDSSEYSKVDNILEKISCEGCKVSCWLLLFLPILSWTEWYHTVKLAKLLSTVSKWQPPKLFLWRQSSSG